MRESDLVRETLGEHVFEWFLANKVDEWNEYKASVSGFELDRYLPRL
jgi:glutamine synthetase